VEATVDTTGGEDGDRRGWVVVATALAWSGDGGRSERVVVVTVVSMVMQRRTH
jgi:hypothetical protein